MLAAVLDQVQHGLEAEEDAVTVQRVRHGHERVEERIEADVALRLGSHQRAAQRVEQLRRKVTVHPGQVLRQRSQIGHAHSAVGQHRVEDRMARQLLVVGARWHQSDAGRGRRIGDRRSDTGQAIGRRLTAGQRAAARALAHEQLHQTHHALGARCGTVLGIAHATGTSTVAEARAARLPERRVLAAELVDEARHHILRAHPVALLDTKVCHVHKHLKVAVKVQPVVVRLAQHAQQVLERRAHQRAGVGRIQRDQRRGPGSGTTLLAADT
mmetsp:Transcript_5856/g.14935  ORF Transcript_5856/g.14935 Transcript_5856/m.14935 type:complete len:270 (-) Transcript_5856:559-1368(-)